MNIPWEVIFPKSSKSCFLTQKHNLLAPSGFTERSAGGGGGGRSFDRSEMKDPSQAASPERERERDITREREFTRERPSRDTGRSFDRTEMRERPKDTSPPSKCPLSSFLIMCLLSTLKIIAIITIIMIYRLLFKSTKFFTNSSLVVSCFGDFFLIFFFRLEKCVPPVTFANC